MGLFPQIIPGAAVVDGASFSINVGFNARAVGIDNYTPYYLYLKDSDTYIAPYWIGAVRVVSHTTDWAYVEVKSPFGAQSPSGTASFIQLKWTDSPDEASTPGTSIGGEASTAPITVVIDQIPSGALTTFHADVTVTTATTTTLYTPTTGKRFNIINAIISTAVKQRVMLIDDTDAVGRRLVGGYFAIDGGIDDVGVHKSGAINRVLKVVTSAAGNCVIEIVGYESD